MNVNGVQYTKSGGSECAICPSKVSNAIKILVVILAILIILGLLLYVNLRKHTESEMSVVLRILTNYI